MIVAATACRSSKSIQTAIARKDTAHVVLVPVVDSRNDSLRFIHQVLDTVQKNRIDFNTFSAKIKVNFEGGRFSGVIQEISFSGMTKHIVIRTGETLIHAAALNENNRNWVVGNQTTWNVRSEAITVLELKSSPIT